MSDSVEEKKVPAEAGEAKGGGEDVAALANSLRLEREKNEVLLAEVVALEDELVNRQLGDFAVVMFNLRQESGMKMQAEEYSLMTRTDIWLRMAQTQSLTPQQADLNGGRPTYRPGRVVAGL